MLYSLLVCLENFDDSAVRWVDVIVDRNSEIEAIGAHLDLHPITVDNLIDIENTRQKLQGFDPYMLIVLNSLQSINEKVSIIVTAKSVWTIHAKKLEFLDISLSAIKRSSVTVTPA